MGAARGDHEVNLHALTSVPRAGKLWGWWNFVAVTTLGGGAGERNQNHFSYSGSGLHTAYKTKESGSLS